MGDVREDLIRSLGAMHAANATVVGPDGTHAPMIGSHNHHHGRYGTQQPGTFHSHEHDHGQDGTPDADHGHHRQPSVVPPSPDDLTGLLIRGAAAAFAGQQDRARTIRLGRLIAQGNALRARAEARQGVPWAQLVTRMSSGSGTYARASWHVWPDSP